MKLVKILKNYSVKKIDALTLILSLMFDWMEETINDSDEVCRWVHQKYGVSQIVKNTLNQN